MCWWVVPGARAVGYRRSMEAGRRHHPPAFDALEEEAAGLGARVARARLHGARGLWDSGARTIWIEAAYSDAWAAPVLAHELEHVRRGHTGPQGPGIERLIDERVARLFVDPVRYARAEGLVGPDPVLIADELGLPAWVVRAFCLPRAGAGFEQAPAFLPA